jgi:DNA-binding transcriptional regulator of glucitol operon
MTAIYRKTLIGGVLVFLGALILLLATSQMRAFIGDIREFSDRTGYVGVLLAATLGVIGLGSLVAGVVFFRFARGRE